MERLFGRPKTDEERTEENRNTIRDAVRQAKRSHDRSERDQVVTINNIRTKARAGCSRQELRIMAKTLVRQRNQAKRFSKIATQLEALSGRMNELRSIQDMNKAMSSVARMMQMMNAQMNPGKVAATMRSIEYENGKMETNMELFDETIDSIMGDEDEEKDTDDVIDRVLDEIGVAMREKLSNAEAPRASPVGQAATASASRTSNTAAQRLPVTPVAPPPAAAAPPPAGGPSVGGSAGSAPTEDFASMRDEDLEERIKKLSNWNE